MQHDVAPLDPQDVAMHGQEEDAAVHVEDAAMHNQQEGAAINGQEGVGPAGPAQGPLNPQVSAACVCVCVCVCVYTSPCNARFHRALSSVCVIRRLWSDLCVCVCVCVCVCDTGRLRLCVKDHGCESGTGGAVA